MGARAFSHESIFIPDGGAESEQTVQAMSQDNILGKVKTLQRQLGKNIKFGQPPPSATTPTKRADSGEASLEEDPSPASPMEPVTPQDIVLSDAAAENRSSDTPSSSSPPNPPGARSEMEEKAAPAKPPRPKRHFSSAGTIESVNLDAIPLAIARLDNSAAKHKLSVKPKNQRVSKKHRRLGLAGNRPDGPGGLPSQLSLDQNGHPGEDKLTWHEEEPEPELLDAEEEQRRQEEYWRELEAKCKRQKAEAAERRRLEEQRLRALEQRLWEENRRQGPREEGAEEEGEGEEGDPQPEAGKRQWPEERRRLDEPGGPAPESREPEEGGPRGAGQQEPPEGEAERLQRLQRQEAKKRRQEEEERELKERGRREELEQLEEQRRQEAEKQWLEEEEKRKRREEEEEQRLREEEERKRREEEEELEEQRLREEEERKLREEEEEQQRLREEEENRVKELRWREEEEEEAKRREEQRKRQEDAEAQQRQQQEAEKEEPRGARGGEESGWETDSAEEPEPLKPGKQRENSAAAAAEEPRACEKQGPAAEPSAEPQGQRGAAGGQDGGAGPEKREEPGTPPPQKSPQKPEVCGAARPARERDRRVEELRWQEVEERQTMPRPYTFQVSSGGKQILFPKVNLSPMTPPKDAGPAPAPHPPKALPSALSIPHTAILVTGAQLCGPAVNLSQIKDTACKSLLGLAEERKPGDAPAPGSPPRARAAGGGGGGGRARAPQEPAASSAAALAEWASIRSRILRRDPPPGGDESAPRGRCDPRGALRRAPPGNAKFSIMPAWQKFSDGGADTSKQGAAESTRKRPAPGASGQTAPPAAAADREEPRKGPEGLGVQQEPADTSEGCKFAKDLPSFLVPSPPSPTPQKAAAHAGPGAAPGSEAAGGPGKPDPGVPAGEDKASLFGIKLRRTNYSLRFHCDQLAEQKRKRRNGGSTGEGDGAEGAPPASAQAQERRDGEQEAEGVALKQGPSLPADSKQGPGARKDPAASPSSLPPAAQPGPVPGGSQALALALEHTKAASRMPLAQKPALAPKPSGQTPPPSPLCRLSRPYLVELLARRPGKPDPEPTEQGKEGPESREPGPPSPPPPSRRGEKEEADTERKAAAPAPSAAPPERPSHTPEAGRKEKPVLQSRHSLDGSKLGEKVETAQPLWITLALQKQKGFREQQATREERKQAREAKQAEKLSKDNVSVSPQPGSSSVGRAGSLPRSTARPGEEKPGTAGTRLERREPLKKANTLPTSVTVEISDSPPPAPPPVQEVTKRFSSPDAAPAATEPAWLALAKRKAKAWSDCPQIIK